MNFWRSNLAKLREKIQMKKKHFIKIPTERTCWAKKFQIKGIEFLIKSLAQRPCGGKKFH